MTVIAHARALLGEASWWRHALLGAVACTVLSIAFPPAGRAPPPTPLSSYTPSTPPVQPSPPPPPNGAQQQAALPVDPQIQARLDVFRGAVSATAGEPSAGVRCERLVDAADKLAPGDATPADDKALREAGACRSDLAASDGRFAELASRAQAGREEVSARTEETLAQAVGRLTPFDLSRGRASGEWDALNAGRAAKAEVEAGDKRIAALDAAAPGAAADAAPSAQERVASAAQRLSPIDEQRLTPAQRDLLAAGRRLGEQFRASDARIAGASSARDDALQVDDDDTAKRLIAAVGRITDGDRARATEAQRAALADAGARAKAAALRLAATAAAAFERDRSVAACEQAAALAAALGAVDRSTLTDDQQHALLAANQASLLLKDSDRRIDALVRGEAAWQKDQSYGPGARLDAALAAASDFDKQRFTPEQRESYRRAQAAHLVMAGRATSLTPQTRGQVPLYVTASEPAAPYANKFRASLRQAGYKLVPDRPSAAMVVDLQAEITAQGPRRIGNTAFEGVLTQVELRSTWAIDQSDFFRATGLGNGVGGTADAALATAYAKAADSLFAQFNSFVEQQGKP